MYYTKIRQSLFAVIFLAVVSFVLAAEPKDLGFIEKMSVSELLNSHGYPKLTAVSGTKTSMDTSDAGPGWYIVAMCRRGSSDEDWIARLWVSTDWKKVEIIEVKKRA